MRARVLLLASLALPLAANLCDNTPFPPDPGAAGHFAVALYGDSLTKTPGYEPWLDESYYTIVRGSYGEKGIEGAGRFRADLPTKLTATEEVDVAVVMWGTNDVAALNYVDRPSDSEDLFELLLGQDPLPANANLGAYDSIEQMLPAWVAGGVVTQAQANQLAADTQSRAELVAAMAFAVWDAVWHGLKVVVALPPDPLNASQVGRDRLAAYRAQLDSALAGFSSSVVRVVDLAPLFSGHSDPASLYTDGVHWTDAGKALAGEAIDGEVAAFAP